jgi:NADH-quinone oxidoreductase subunit A
MEGLFLPPVLSFVVLLGIICAFGFAMVFVTSLLGPKPSASIDKEGPYECGMEPSTKNGKHVKINFYLVAVLFVLFDIEIIFLYPWALVYTDLLEQGFGHLAFFSMLFFVTLFVFGLFWEVKSKALDWK